MADPSTFYSSIYPSRFLLHLSLSLARFTGDDPLSLETHSFLPIRYRVGRAVDETRASPELYFYLSPRRHHDSSLRLLGSASSLGGAGDK